MKKKAGLVLLCLMLALSMAACGSSDSKETAAETEAADETEVLEDEDEEYNEAEPIAVADYDPDEYVKLGEYKGLEVDLRLSEVTDEDLEYEIESRLEEFEEEQEKDGPAEEGDSVVGSVKLTVDGQEVEEAAEEEMELPLGFGELGDEVDEALTGAKAGDTVTAEALLDDTYGEDYEDKTGTYEIKIAKVLTYVMPELTDEYVKENLNSDSVDAYREKVRAELLASMEEESRTTAGDTLLNQVTENAEISGHPEDLYESVHQSHLEFYEMYAQMFGSEVEDLISEEELDAEVLQDVNSQMVMKAIVKKEGLAVTDEEYQQYWDTHLAQTDFESLEELEGEYSREELEEEVLRDKVYALLLENATVHELSAEEYSAKYGEEELDGEAVDDEELGDDELILEDEGEELSDEEAADTDDAELGEEASEEDQ